MADVKMYVWEVECDRGWAMKEPRLRTFSVFFSEPVTMSTVQAKLLLTKHPDTNRMVRVCNRFKQFTDPLTIRKIEVF